MEVKRLQAYKFELMPNGANLRGMRQYAGARRFVFNKALALSQRYYRRFKRTAGYVNLANQLPKWKKLHPFLKEAPSQVLQQSLKDLDKAYVNFFKGNTDFPTFKKKSQGGGFRYPQGCELDQPNSRIKLPKIGWVQYRNSRAVEGLVKNVTLSSKSNRWFMSVQTERAVVQEVHPATTSIGIDVGITRFATLSDETFFAPLNSFKKNQLKLSKYQRQFSRKKKFSKNWLKAKCKITQLHTDIANARLDFLHKTSTIISKNHAMIFVEDLQVSNMSKSSKGTVESPGKKVKQKSGLNRSILDQGWGEFRRQLEYKSNWTGGECMAVPPKNTSRTCPCCRHISGDNRKTQSMFLCVECGYTNNADVVGAINVRTKGLKILEGQDTIDDSIGRIKTVAQLAYQVNGAVIPSAIRTHRSDLSLTV